MSLPLVQGIFSRHTSWTLGQLIYMKPVYYSNANEIRKAILPDWIYARLHFTLAPSCMQFHNYCSTLLPWSIRHHKVEHRYLNSPVWITNMHCSVFLFKASCRRLIGNQLKVLQVRVRSSQSTWVTS